MLTFGATNLNDAIELLNMLGEASLGGNQDQSSSQSHDDKQGINEQKKEDIMHNVKTAENMDAEKLKSERQLTTNKSRSKIPPLFLQDGITDSFRGLVNQVECETEADYLCLAAHALILEAGFQNKVGVLFCPFIFLSSCDTPPVTNACYILFVTLNHSFKQIFTILL